MKRSIVKSIISAGILCVNVSCANVGLAAIPQTREGYNQALSNSDDQQFLLNIVRMHFGQTPYFVNVENMVTSSTLTTSTGAGSSITNGINVPAGAQGPFWALSPQVTFTQTPTITYTPLQGSQFVSGMLAPMTLEKLSLLLQSGWSTAEVLKLTVEQIGTLNNGTTALHPLSDLSPAQVEYNKFVDTLDQLDIENRVDFGTTTYKASRAVILNFDDESAAVEVAKLLHLKKSHNQLIFTHAIVLNENAPENVIFVQTRSFFSMLNFLSKGVSSDDVMSRKYGIKRLVKHGNLLRADTSLTDGIFLVSESHKEPANAATKVSFDNHWYAIANDDIASKSTLVLLRITYALQSGDLKANVPLITIPTK